MKGKGLTASNLRSLLEASYSGAEFPAENWSMDKELSIETARVYKHPSGQVVVAHRGTEGSATDWGNNARYGTTGEIGYKQTDRFKISKEVQKNTEAKYGERFVTTIGHSQGGLLAELLGKNSREIITVNKATSPWGDNTPSNNQYDIRSDCDKVSMFRNPFKKPREKDTVIKGKRNAFGCKNSVAEHSYDILNRRDDHEVFGDRAFYQEVTAAYQQQLNADKQATMPPPPPQPTPVQTLPPAPVEEAPVEEVPVEGKGISKYSRDKAKSLGVNIKSSTKKGKKIDVSKDGKLVASIGAKGYKDYPTYLAENGKKEAEKRRKLYKMRHEKDRHNPGSPGYYADKILW
jgi:hypothetical protein